MALEDEAADDDDTLTRFRVFEMIVRVALYKYEPEGLKPVPAVTRLYEVEVSVGVELGSRFGIGIAA